jgi:hypothetical protein
MMLIILKESLFFAWSRVTVELSKQLNSYFVGMLSIQLFKQASFYLELLS